MDRESERALVGRLRAGDPAAFDVVFETYNRRLFAFLARLTRRSAWAEDLVEETWLRLVAHAERLDPDTRLGPWLFTVARNLHTSAWRASRLDAVLASGGLFDERTAAAQSASPFEVAAADQLQQRIERALLSLPAPDREVLLLVGVEGFTPSEAAEICGIAPEALRQRLSRARGRFFGNSVSRGSRQEARNDE